MLLPAGWEGSRAPCRAFSQSAAEGVPYVSPWGQVRCWLSDGDQLVGCALMPGFEAGRNRRGSGEEGRVAVGGCQQLQALWEAA